MVIFVVNLKRMIMFMKTGKKRQRKIQHFAQNRMKCCIFSFNRSYKLKNVSFSVLDRTIVIEELRIYATQLISDPINWNIGE